MNQVEVSGQITVGGTCEPCASGNSKMQGLGLRCASQWFQTVVSTDAPYPVQTAGAVGDSWIDVPTTDALDSVELLMVRSDAPMRLRIGAGPAALLGVAATFPTGFVGGETLGVDLDGVSIAVVFTVGAQTAQQVANQINAAAALAGLSYQPASVVGGQVQIAGQATGVQGAVAVTGGTAQAALGYGGGNDSATGEGSDVDILGLFLVEFGRSLPTAPERVQLSGIGRIEVFAAGTTA